MFDLNDIRWSSLARYHDSTLEHATVALVISRVSIGSHFDVIGHLGERVVVRLMSEMHGFAFNCRKAVEIASKFRPEIMDLARTTKLKRAGQDIESEGVVDKIRLVDRDFWWIINRIVHSQEVMCQTITKIVDATPTHIYSVDKYRVFGFRSDLDPGDELHCALIGEIIGIYIYTLAPLIRGAIEDRRKGIS